MENPNVIVTVNGAKAIEEASKEVLAAAETLNEAIRNLGTSVKITVSSEPINPIKPLKWEVGARVLVKRTLLARDCYASRVGYVGKIIKKESNIFLVEFDEASFGLSGGLTDGVRESKTRYQSWWSYSELELVDDSVKGKAPVLVPIGKAYLAADGKSLTHNAAKAFLTNDYATYLTKNIQDAQI